MPYDYTERNKVDSNSLLKDQRQTILNLYNSGIEPDVISYQPDISQEEVNKVIEEDEKNKELEVKQMLNSPLSIGRSSYLDAVVNIDLAIRNAQTRMWKALKSGPEFNISTEETDKILNQFSKSKITFVKYCDNNAKDNRALTICPKICTMIHSRIQSLAGLSFINGKISRLMKPRALRSDLRKTHYLAAFLEANLSLPCIPSSSSRM